MWQFLFEASAGTRILRSRFFGITQYNSNLMFDSVEKKWTYPCSNGGSSHATCRSFKAFKRHLRKHLELQEAGEVTLESRYIGCNIIARWVPK